MRLILSILLFPLVCCGQTTLSGNLFISGNAVIGFGSAGGVSAPDIWWLKGNTGSGTTDTATVGPNGTLSNAAIWTNSFTPGGSSTDWYFPESSTYHVDSASTINYATNKITVEFRIYAASYANALAKQHILHNKFSDIDNVYTVYNDTDSGTGTFVIEIIDHSLNSGKWTFVRPSTTTWHHIAVVLDESAANDPVVYVDGSSVSVTTVSDTRANFQNFKTNITYINTANSGAATFLPGIACKDFRIYSGPRSASDILVDSTAYP